MNLFDVLPVDRAYYRDRLMEFLPDRLFDCHTHVYMKKTDEEDEEDEEDEDAATATAPKRTVIWPSLVADQNPIEHLIETAALMFPGKGYVPLMFSMVKKSRIDESNAYVAENAKTHGFPALMLTPPNTQPDDFVSRMTAGGFIGIKVYLTFAPKYIPAEEIRIFDYLPHHILAECDKRCWVVMLHIPRSGRLRDPVNLAQLLEIEQLYKNLRLIVAHVGRAYCNDDVAGAFEALEATENMMFDISANTNPFVFGQLIKAVGCGRILFGSDLPVTRMRMKRVVRQADSGEFYVNQIPRGLYGDVSGDRHMEELDPPEADALSFFMYEEIEAFRQAAIKLGVTRTDAEKVFWGNGRGLYISKGESVHANKNWDSGRARAIRGSRVEGFR